MSEINIDLLRKDECQPLTTEQMNDIKSQFHPSNTANVNIVPYEIYDEDGVEQVIGEVRKTIDGIKKKKPVYRFINSNITIPSADGDVASVGLSNVDDVRVILVAIHNTSDSNYVSATSSYTRMGFYYVPSTDKLRVAGVEGFAKGKPAKLTIEYTKTTDEWQPV